MRWRGRRQSDNVVDRRGSRRLTGRNAGGGAAILIILVGLFFGPDVQNILAPLLQEGLSPAPQTHSQQASQNDEASQFVRTILAETEDTWDKVFAQMGRQYQAPKLVLFSGMVQSACGAASAQSGPFYCPGDYQIYIDLNFLEQLQRMGAPGDFAFAYVIAHEVGHHIQNLLGVASQVRQLQMRGTKVQSNALSVKMELQADCLAGVWINHTEKRSAILEEGDVEEGLNAAAAVGDDQIMRNAGRSVQREAFTHGSSKERTYWFTQGMRTGDVKACNTFG